MLESAEGLLLWGFVKGQLIDGLLPKCATSGTLVVWSTGKDGYGGDMTVPPMAHAVWLFFAFVEKTL